MFRSVRGHTDDVGASAGSTTVSRLVALPDENDSNVAYVERRLASLPSRACSSASWSAVRSSTAMQGVRSRLGCLNEALGGREILVDRLLERRLAALDGRRDGDQLLGQCVRDRSGAGRDRVLGGDGEQRAVTRCVHLHPVRELAGRASQGRAP